MTIISDILQITLFSGAVAVIAAVMMGLAP
jgi:hypothetical protein